MLWTAAGSLKLSSLSAKCSLKAPLPIIKTEEFYEKRHQVSFYRFLLTSSFCRVRQNSGFERNKNICPRNKNANKQEISPSLMSTIRKALLLVLPSNGFDSSVMHDHQLSILNLEECRRRIQRVKIKRKGNIKSVE